MTLRASVLLSLLTGSREANEEWVRPKVEKNCSRANEGVVPRLQIIDSTLAIPSSAYYHRIDKSMTVVSIRFGESSPVTKRSIIDNAQEPCGGEIQDILIEQSSSVRPQGDNS